MGDEYPYNGRISRWEEIADGLAIAVGPVVGGALRVAERGRPAAHGSPS